MHKEAVKKVPNGKLLRIKVDFDSTIKKIEITGDFFAYPEESINEIEKKLTGLKTVFDSKDLISQLNKIIQEKNYELIGVNAEAIVDVLKQALK